MWLVATVLKSLVPAIVSTLGMFIHFFRNVILPLTLIIHHILSMKKMQLMLYFESIATGALLQYFSC